MGVFDSKDSLVLLYFVFLWRNYWLDLCWTWSFC